MLRGEQELYLARQSSLTLSEKDRWENNGILSHIHSWAESETPSLLWIGGQCGNQDPWVTEFSADLVTALSSQDTDSMQAHIFINGETGTFPSSVNILRTLITRFIEKRPALVTEMPDILNSRILGGIGSFLQTWAIFEAVLERLDSLFLVIDRIDESVEDDLGTPAVDELLPRLLGVVNNHLDKVKIVVTSTQEPPPKWKDNRRLSYVWLDTGMRQLKRDRR